MTPWTPQPSAALATDLPLLLSAPEVQALVFRLGHVARGGRVSFVGEPVAAAVALCGGARWAAGALSDAVDAGFVHVEERTFVLAWEWPTLATVGSDAAPRPSSVPASAPPPPRERVSGDRAGERRLRALWSRYGLHTTEARLAWIDSPAGARALEREGRDRSWAEALAGRVSANTGGRFGCPSARTTTDNSPTDNPDGQPSGQPRTTATDNSTDNSADNRSPSPAPPPSEKNKKESQNGRADAGTTDRTTATDNRTDNRTDNHDDGEPGQLPRTTTDNRAAPRLPTVERPADAVGAGEVFMALRGAGGLRLTTSGAHEVELERILAAVTPTWRREGVHRLAAHIRAGHLREGWKPALSHLRGKDGSWTTLLSLYDEAQGCDRCRPSRPPAHAPISTLVSEEPPRPRPVFTEETAKKFEVFTRARRAEERA